MNGLWYLGHAKSQKNTWAHFPASKKGFALQIASIWTMSFLIWSFETFHQALFRFGLVLFPDNLVPFPVQTNLIYILLLTFGIVFVQGSRN